MPSTATNAQGTKLEIGPAASAAKNITAATKANPVKLTSTAHGLTDGAVVAIASVVGMTELNGKVGVVRVVDANNFELPGIDSTNFTTYTSGGTATPGPQKVGNLRGYSGFDGQASDIDVSNFDSTAKEFRAGLRDQGQVQFTVHTDDADVGQQALRSSAAASGPLSLFTLTLRSGKKRTFSGYVKQFSESGAVDGVVEAQVTVRISGDVALA